MATGYTGGQDQAGDPRVEDVTADQGVWSDITGAASTAGNFLWSNLIWDSEAPLWMNLGGAAISVVSIAAAIPSGGLSLAGGAALRASMGVVAKAALSEVAVGTVTAAGMYAAAEGIEYVTGDEPQDTLSDEEYQAALDELSALSTPGSPEALAHAAAREAELAAEETAAEEAETPAAEEEALSPIEQNYNETVAGLQTMLGSFIPDELEGVVINLCAMFQMATMGDGDENTSKLDELSFLGGKFFDAVMGGTPSQDVPAPANADRAPRPEMALVS